MTTTYDPRHSAYTDEADVRHELARVFDHCHGCRKCSDFCGSFPTLFEMIDQLADHDAGRMTPAQQDQVIDQCFQCKLCYVACPYVHEREIDLPRLLLRATAMRHEHGHRSARAKATAALMGRVDRVGKLATRAAPVVNRIVAAKPRSLVRTLTAKISGVSAERLLVPYAGERFSAWLKARPTVRIGKKQGTVALVATCAVEYQATAIGKDLVKVYERNGIECSLSGAGCCGAPWLAAGDIKRFTRAAERNVKTLAGEVRRGADIVVAQPTCGYVVKHDYVDYVGGVDATLVAAHTYDAAEYLMKLHGDGDSVLDTNFRGRTYGTITYHALGHLLGSKHGFKSRDLLKLTGAKVNLIQQSSGVEGPWGFIAGHEDAALAIAKRLADQIQAAGGEVVVADCHLASTVIVEQSGIVAQHPIQILARAYGIPEEV